MSTNRLLDHLTLRCAFCAEAWMVPGANAGEVYLCRDCSTAPNRNRPGIEEPLADLVVVIEEAVELVAHSAKKKGVQIYAEYFHEASRVVGDSDRLRQSFWNLLSKAVAVSPGAGRMEIRLEKCGASAEVTVRLAVKANRGTTQQTNPVDGGVFRVRLPLSCHAAHNRN